MKISIFGLGYVGSISAACFANDGHEVIGVDVNQAKVALVNSGASPVAEIGLNDLMRKVVAQGKLRATTDAAEAVSGSDFSFVCVGTPGHTTGEFDLRYVTRVSEEIGHSLRDKQERHIIIVRSTMLPGTLETVVIPILERYSDKTSGHGFGICVNPEFLREGSSVKDFYSPPFTVIGTTDRITAAAVSRLYANLDAPIITLSPKAAEILKCACNCFHAIKVNFANEIGSICTELGIDSVEVMEVFCSDMKLNLSPYYLKPGFAFGGSCLPKDIRAVISQARQLRLDVPLLSGLIASNSNQIKRALEMVRRAGKNRVGLLGLSFKAGTDDLRESPLVTLLQQLISNRLNVLVYDPEVVIGSLIGANKDYIDDAIPNISQYLA